MCALVSAEVPMLQAQVHYLDCRSQMFPFFVAQQEMSFFPLYKFALQRLIKFYEIWQNVLCKELSKCDLFFKLVSNFV